MYTIPVTEDPSVGDVITTPVLGVGVVTVTVVLEVTETPAELVAVRV